VEWDDSQEPVRLSHRLTVQVPPSVYPLNVTSGRNFREDNRVEAAEFDDVRLKCVADGVPKPVITWVSELH